MTREEFRRFCTARPFRPFTAILADGQRIPVWDREFVMISPTGRTASGYQQNGALDIIDLLLVTNLQFQPPTEAAAQG